MPATKPVTSANGTSTATSTTSATRNPATTATTTGWRHQNNASPTHKDPVNFVLNGKEMGPLKGFSAPLVAEEGRRWLTEVRDKEKPFLLSVWTHEPHLPIESSPEFMKHYADMDNPGFRQHHGNVTQLDHAFGIIMRTLEEIGATENTFVIFTSDNGPEGNGFGDKKNPDSQRNRTRGSTGGLRGRKRDSHEGGIRVAGIARWPGHIEPGTVSKVPVIGSDIFPTVLKIAGVPPPPRSNNRRREHDSRLQWKARLQGDSPVLAHPTSPRPPAMPPSASMNGN